MEQGKSVSYIRLGGTGIVVSPSICNNLCGNEVFLFGGFGRFTCCFEVQLYACRSLTTFCYGGA